MKRLFFVVLILSTSIMAMGQDVNSQVVDEKTGHLMLIGEVNRQGMENMGTWFSDEYEAYQPQADVMAEIKSLNADFPHVFIVMGTWCSDSREQVPHFYKLMDAIDYPDSQVFVVGVNREKKADNFCLGDFDIHLVPTFIFTRDGKEIGRIVESPSITLEHDLLNILLGPASIH
ncbi:MAG: thioredoxin family protein [Lentimicrobium sp.]|nr:thioredoxin family protein [Lentimicrobium sp.]MDD2526980.1 thioredoxin family protein [Lentimicrobiaceae bacterium]MDD4597824.1 thioredoxin family protein [Lentimicrobiaceae bacterium]MDY0024994.1 thioredoxin family protein [Lentimicrobium sp.]